MVTTREQADPRYQSFMDGCRAVLDHPVFQAMTGRHLGADSLAVTWSEDLELVRQRGWARVRRQRVDHRQQATPG